MEPTINTNARDITKLQSENKTLFKALEKHEENHEELVKLMHSIDTAVALAGKDREAARKSNDETKETLKQFRDETEANIKKMKEEMKEEIEKLSAEVEALKDRPRKRWESILTAIILAIVGVIVGIVLAKIGLTP